MHMQMRRHECLARGTHSSLLPCPALYRTYADTGVAGHYRKLIVPCSASSWDRHSTCHCRKSRSRPTQVWAGAPAAAAAAGGVLGWEKDALGAARAREALASEDLGLVSAVEHLAAKQAKAGVVVVARAGMVVSRVVEAAIAGVEGARVAMWDSQPNQIVRRLCCSSAENSVGVATSTEWRPPCSPLRLSAAGHPPPPPPPRRGLRGSGTMQAHRQEPCTLVERYPRSHSPTPRQAVRAPKGVHLHAPSPTAPWLRPAQLARGPPSRRRRTQGRGQRRTTSQCLRGPLQHSEIAQRAATKVTVRARPSPAEGCSPSSSHQHICTHAGIKKEPKRPTYGCTASIFDGEMAWLHG